jgi:hypothetical protein
MAVATTTSIADLPDWQKQYATDILSRAQALGRQDYTLPAYQVAARSPMQQQASQLAVQGIGAYQPMLQAGAGTVGSGVETMRAALDPLSASIQSAGQIGSQTAANIMDPTGVQAFMSPYEQAVIDQSMQDIRRAGDIAMQGTRAQAVGAGAFGGSRSGIAEQELNRNVLEQQARTAAQLRASGFQQAQQQQLQRAQAAGQVGLQGAQLMQSGAGQYGALGQGLGSLGLQQARLGEAQQGLSLNDINTLLSLGGQEQGQQQAILDAQRQTQYQNVMTPYQQLGFYSDIFQGMPTAQQTFTQQQTPNPSMISQIGGLGLGLYGMNQAGMFGQGGLFGANL